MFKKNDVFELYIQDLTDDGDGVGKTDSFVWFVKDTIPGDLVEVVVMKTKKSYGYAKLKKVLTPSPNRVNPLCSKSSSCGGCVLQCMDYNYQLNFKRRKVINNLVHIGGFDLNLIEDLTSDTIGMDYPWRYRNKGIYAVGKNKDGKLIAGFYARHSHNIIECNDCLLQPVEFKKIIDECKSENISHLFIRKGFKTNEIMAYSVENFDNNSVMSGKLNHVYGSATISDYISDLKFKISPQSFYQVNPIQVEKLYSKVKEFCDLSGNEVVWDLYCGIGTISLYLARYAKFVCGIEIVEEAIRDAKENALINNINNVEFIAGKSEDIIRNNSLVKPDIVVVDPPRKGCDPDCITSLINFNPFKIVYVSCDSATLARDLKNLCANGYTIQNICPVDMFPQTIHVETVVLMSRKAD